MMVTFRWWSIDKISVIALKLNLNRSLWMRTDLFLFRYMTIIQIFIWQRFPMWPFMEFIYLIFSLFVVASHQSSKNKNSELCRYYLLGKRYPNYHLISIGEKHVLSLRSITAISLNNHFPGNKNEMRKHTNDIIFFLDIIIIEIGSLMKLF